MKELDRIPKEVYAEAEKYGVLEKDILFSALADKNCDGVYCDNWVIVTNDEILMLGGIELVVPDVRHRRRSDPRKLCVKYGKISADRLDRKDLSDYKTEKQIGGCIMTAYNNKTESYTIITYLSCEKESNFIKLCRFLNESSEDGNNDAPQSEGKGSRRGPGAGGPPPGGPGFPPPSGDGDGEGEGEGEGEDSEYCPKCGRRYPDPQSKICPHCVDKSSVVGRLFTFAKKYRVSVIMVFAAMALSSALGIISPYISSGFFYDQVLTVGGKLYAQVLTVVLMIVALRVLSLMVQTVSNVITARVVPKIVYDLKETIFSSIERLSLSFFTNRRTGALMNQVNSDSNTIYWFFVEGFPDLVIYTVQTVAVGIVMLFIDWRLTLISVCFCPAAVFGVKWLYGVMKKLHARRYSASRSMSGMLTDVLGGVRVVKAFARESDEIARFDRKSEELASAEKKAYVFEMVAFPSVTFMFVVSSVLITGIGGWYVMHGSLTYGSLLAFLSYASMLYNPLIFFVNITQSITDCFNATYRLMEVMDAEPEVREKPNAISLENLDGRVTFEKVCFGYDKSRRVIENISFDIGAGEKIGIVGHTGAGKSTIANLLIRLWDPDEGRILIDGIDIRELSFETIRKNIAIVSQETYLFQGTILDNIKYANPDATMEEVITASKISGAHDFISKLPDGYSTMLGWGYKDLSGGERQRVSIARAILRDPKILILDEATSAMDTKTERSIQAALEKLTDGRTTIMIAHRLSTLRDAGRLMVIEHGKIAEEGSHMELISEKGIYFKLYSLQYEALKNAGIEE